MVSTSNNFHHPTTLADVKDDAVGMPESHWFVAVVRHNTERTLQDFLAKSNIETFLASQKRLRVYSSGRKKWTDQILIAGKLFIKCSEKQRLEIVKHPFVYKFLTDPSKRNHLGNREIAVVPEKEIQTLRFMLGQKDYPVSIVEKDFQPGDTIKILRGSLKGLEGKILHTLDNKREIAVLLDFFGCAKVTLPATDIELTENKA